MRTPLHTVDVFTDVPFGGNPLGVVPDARALDADAMQAVARELALSETAFVLPGADPSRPAVRIFTPAAELPFAGHPVLGTAFLLVDLGLVNAPEDAEADVGLTLVAPVGPVGVAVHRSAGVPTGATLTAARPVTVAPAEVSAEEVAATVGLGADDLGGAGPAVADAGLAFTVLALRDVAALERAALDRAAFARVLGATDAPHLYLITPEGDGLERLRARMFAPTLGVDEDPATGSAAAALGGLLARAPGGDGTRRWRVTQGVEMGRSSVLHVEADVTGGAATAVRVRGACVRMLDGVLRT